MSATPASPAPDHVFVIAEAGVNHNGDPALAADLVRAAAASGADSVKFQTFDPDALVAASTVTASYQKQATGIDDQREMLRGLVLPDTALHDLAQQCDQLGIEFLSTPFDHGSADALARLGVKRFKVGSGDVTNTPLLRHIASFGLPVILSTGMATMDEIDEAVAALDAIGDRLTILHCVSAYPTPMAQANLLAIRTLQARFGPIIGYSDHTLGGTASLGAVALGATAIEKHLTLDCALPGPDHRASLEPEPFRDMVATIRDMSAALGDGVKHPQQEELETRQVARRGIKLARDLAGGHVLSGTDVAILRPETGLHPRHVTELEGRKLVRAMTAGQPLDWADLVE
jgi:N,N'-diacetyllegionaminate synthase